MPYSSPKPWLYRLRRGQWPFLLPLLVLLVPGATRGPLQRKVVVPCQEPETGLVDLDAGPSRPLPAVFPDEWRREPCPSGVEIRVIRGACFVATKGRPPCSVGFEHNGECVLPGAKAKPFPSSIQR